MSDLAFEIKKLADKYRNNKKTGLLDIDAPEDESNIAYEPNVSENDHLLDEFNDEKLNSLEREISDFKDFDGGVDIVSTGACSGDVAKEKVHGEGPMEDVEIVEERVEIQISDFINPVIEVANNSGVAGISEEADGDLADVEGDRRSVSENLRVVSRNLRDLKALLRG